MKMIEIIAVLRIVSLLLGVNFQQQRLFARILVEDQIGQLMLQLNTLRKQALLENKTFALTFNPAAGAYDRAGYQEYHLTRLEYPGQALGEREVVYREYYDSRLILLFKGEVVADENFTPISFTGQGTASSGSLGFKYQGYSREIVVNNRGRIYSSRG